MLKAGSSRRRSCRSLGTCGSQHLGLANFEPVKCLRSGDFLQQVTALEIAGCGGEAPCQVYEDWKSEAGRMRGTIRRVVTSPTEFKGYTVHAT